MLNVLLTTFICTWTQWSFGENSTCWSWWHHNFPSSYSRFTTPLCFSHSLPWPWSFKLCATLTLPANTVSLFQQLLLSCFHSTTGTSPIQILGFFIQPHTPPWVLSKREGRQGTWAKKHSSHFHPKLQHGCAISFQEWKHRRRRR